MLHIILVHQQRESLEDFIWVSKNFYLSLQFAQEIKIY